MQSHILKGTLLVIIGTILFSIKAILIQWIFQYQVSVDQLILMRMTIALPIYCGIGLYVWRSRARRQLPLPSPKSIAAMGAAGILCYHLASYLDMWALQFISAGLERIVLMTYPLMVACIQHIQSERINGRQWGFIVMAYVGTVLFYYEDQRHFGDEIIVGTLIVLLAALCTAVFSLMSHRYSQRYSGSLFSAIAMSITGVSVVSHVVLFSPPIVWVHTPTVWGIAITIAIGSTVLASLAFNNGIALAGATRGTVAGMAGPLITMLLAALLLDAPFTPTHLIALAIVITGIVGLKRAAPSPQLRHHHQNGRQRNEA